MTEEEFVEYKERQLRISPSAVDRFFSYIPRRFYLRQIVTAAFILLAAIVAFWLYSFIGKYH
jgi:hypothetical protein